MKDQDTHIKTWIASLAGESHTSAGFKGVGTKGEDVGGEAGLEKSGLVGGYRGGGHGSSSNRTSRWL